MKPALFQDGEFVHYIAQTDKVCAILDFSELDKVQRRSAVSFEFQLCCVIENHQNNFLVGRTMREEGENAGLFGSLLPFLPLGFQHL